MTPNEVVSKYQQTLSKMADDYFLKVIAGAESLDTFDDFVQRWKSSGGDAVTEEINKWYSSY